MIRLLIFPLLFLAVSLTAQTTHAQGDDVCVTIPVTAFGKTAFRELGEGAAMSAFQAEVQKWQDLAEAMPGVTFVTWQLDSINWVGNEGVFHVYRADGHVVLCGPPWLVIPLLEFGLPSID